MDRSEAENSESNKIKLIIENRNIKCRRSDLVQNSDYFKAMLEGDFIEREKDTIKLDDVSYDGMVHIIYLLQDREHLLGEELLLLVLETSCMLQFLAIKDLCLRRVLRMLSPRNCLKLWMLGEKLFIENLAKKAKLLALMEFQTVRVPEVLFETDLRYICLYLGSVNLQCRSEWQVFESAMAWYSNVATRNKVLLLNLLQCLDFGQITTACIDQMMLSPNIKQDVDVVGSLKCVRAIKDKVGVTGYQENWVQTANNLMATRSRNFQGYPCFLVDNYDEDSQDPSNKVTVIYHDKYKRKRKYNVLDNNCSNTDLSVIYFDPKTGRMKKLIDLAPLKLATLNGFKMVGYKHFIYMFGGEWELGKGVWNMSLHVYDLLSEVWVLKTDFPYAKRHFGTTVSGNYLYVVMGTGLFRVLQDKIFWYDLQNDIWSHEAKLPCSGREVKCCDYNGKLFLFDINEKSGYILATNRGTPNRGDWLEYVIPTTTANNLQFSHVCALYSYKSKIFIKERCLYEFKVSNYQLILERTIQLISYENCSYIDYVLCNDILYTLYGQDCEDTRVKCIIMESFNVNTHETRTIFRKTTADVTEEIDGEVYKLRPSLNLFSVFHCNAIQGDELVNELG